MRYRLAGIAWTQLLESCRTFNYRAALVGSHGSGKTTLLEDLGVKLRERGFATKMVGLSSDQPFFEPGFLKCLSERLTGRDILLFDGAEQLNPAAWHWFRWRTRKAGGLIITSHQRGRLPLLWQCRTSVSLLADIASELLGVPARELHSQAELLFSRNAGNVRDALREWYDLLSASKQSFA